MPPINYRSDADFSQGVLRAPSKHCGIPGAHGAPYLALRERLNHLRGERLDGVVVLMAANQFDVVLA